MKVIIVGTTGLADALVAAPLIVRGPDILLWTNKDSIPQSTKDEITRLQPEMIYAIGGPVRISQAVIDELTTMSPLLDWVWGSTLIDTAVEVSKRLYPN